MKYTTQIISSSLIALSLLISINTNAQRIITCSNGQAVTRADLCPASDAVRSGQYNANPDAKPTTTALEAGLLAWRPAFSSAVVTSALFTIALTSIGAGTNFLYFKF